MNFKSLINASAFIIASSFAVACSNPASNSGDSKPKTTEQAAPAAASANSSTDVAVASDNTAAAAPAGGAAFDSAKFASEASLTSQAPIGCSLPDAIAKQLTAKGQLTNTKEGSWTASSTAANVASAKVGNLDLATCPWYRQAKATGGAYYIITYTDPNTKQTHAQLSTSVNPIAFAVCLTEAASLGAICGFMP